ncbi:MAG: cysteine-rich small domain-containing protein [Bacilli bacterium]
MKNNYKFFSNKDCEYFPCHEVENESEFNCLFCFCPLYLLGDNCGGCFDYTSSNFKSCINCILPHEASFYEVVIEKLKANNNKS